MFDNSRTPNVGRFRCYITGIEVQPLIVDPSVKMSMKVFLDDELVLNLPWIDDTQPCRWERLSLCDVSPSCKIVLRLNRSINGNYRSFNFPPHRISEMDQDSGETTLEHPEALYVAKIKYLTPITAEKLFPDELDRLSRIDGIYNSLKPDDTVKYLLKPALTFASIVAETATKQEYKSTFLIIMKAWKLLNQQNQIDDNIQAILHGLVHIREIVEVLNQASSSTLTRAIHRSGDSINDLLLLLEHMSVYIFNRLAMRNPGDALSDGLYPSNRYDLEAYLTKLEDLQKAFYASWSASTVSGLYSTDITDNEICRMTKSDFSCVVDEPIAGSRDPYEMLNLLRPMDPSGYDPDQACMPGTREGIINRIITWTQNRDHSEHFLWVSGQAGMGKTSIATSLCQHLDNIGALAASFFCQHDNPDRSDPLRLINNIVHEMALQFPAYAREVSDAVRANRRLCNAHLGLRYEGLLKRPLEKLKALSVATTFVVVIDGLDECGDFSSRRKVLQNLYDMSRLVPWLKFVITGRPTGDLQEDFRTYCPHEPLIYLHSYDASDDIRTYVKGKLGQLAKKERWPNSSIDQLCAMAQGLFLWAVLATKYITKSTLLALPRLRAILSNKKSCITNYLDILYTRALKIAIDATGDENKDCYFKCIGAILTISEFEPLSVPDLQYLLLVAGRIDQTTLEQVIDSLSPLLIATNGRYAKFHHPSFRDYITDPSRSGEFLVRVDQYNAEPAACCLHVMQRDLRFNICQLETSHLLNNQVPDLQLRIQTHIGPALRYACTHWIDHFMASPTHSLIEVIKDFLKGPQLLYWIEVLSLLGRLDIAITGFSNLISLTLTAQFADWSIIVFWIKDIYRFLLSFHEVIAASAPHLYISALAFSPTNSITARRMRQYFPNIITVAQGGDLIWHECVKTTLHPHPVQALAVSRDGLWVSTGYPDGSVCIWDMQTNARIRKPLMGHSTSVTCVSFSPKGNFIASSSYDTAIRVWDISVSPEINHLLAGGHSGSIHAVTFAPNGELMASGSSDKTVRLWATKTMQCIGQPYVGHSNRVSCLAFSPDGTKLVSGSWDKTIRVWSVDLGGSQLALSPLLMAGHTDLITCVIFSPDGSKIASGSVDRTIRIWDPMNNNTESRCSPTKHSDSITSISFALNGNLVASGSLDGAIRLWDTETFTAFSHPFGHFNSVNGIAFSLDGSYIVSGSTDMTTRFWEVNACPKAMMVAPLVGHSLSIQSIAITSDGTRVISGASDSQVRVWDAQNGTLIGSPLVEHSGDVNCVAISPDGARFVSGSDDRTLKLWDTAKQTVIHSYEHDSAINCAVFSPDGALIAFGSSKSIYLWESTGWKKFGAILQGHSRTVLSVAFSPDGACIASASADGQIFLWDLETRRRLGDPLLGHADWVRAVVFSPYGTQLVSGSDDGTVILWDVKTGETIRKLSGNFGYVLAIAFSPDGSFLASGSNDNTVRLWDTKTGQMVRQPFTDHLGSVRSVAFSPYGNYVISGSYDNTIQVQSFDTVYPATEETTCPPNTFCWPASPYALSSRPHQLGWVTHDGHSAAFWLPAHYQQPDQYFSIHTQVPPREIYLDYSKFVHGTEWTSVACDSIKQGLE
ncbi:unnamed protein product [Rhizoctonia solani]|uniref:Intraflagellar transport protein 122 homolog n=1 Tax=Rhizoctonia solani TaxID=456999 RepID=A0A8H2X5V4_9AGAM|nr:unnamed protein product [Rhizoctonia solani]